MVDDSTTNRNIRNGRFYLSIAVASTLLVFAGFARTYYLRRVFGFPALPGFLHLHGLVMSLWFVLFFCAGLAHHGSANEVASSIGCLRSWARRVDGGDDGDGGDQGGSSRLYRVSRNREVARVPLAESRHCPDFRGFVLCRSVGPEARRHSQTIDGTRVPQYLGARYLSPSPALHRSGADCTKKFSPPRSIHDPDEEMFRVD